MSAGPSVRVVDLRAEHREGFGIGTAKPRLSWRTTTATEGWRQASYEIEVVDGSGLAATTGPTVSSESVLVDWPGEALTSRARRTVRVRVTGVDGSTSPWSDPLELEAGLLDPGDWSAVFASPEVAKESTALLRGAFTVEGEVAAARLYVTALGLYEIELNGRVVGDHVLAPGWSSYDHRLRYETFDVTALVGAGANVLGARLAEGWYRGRIGNDGGRRGIYGDRLALLAQLEIAAADGSVTTVGTGAAWRGAPGPTTRSGIYDGEDHDARLEPEGWSSPGFDDSAWEPVGVVDRDLAAIVARSGPPVRRIERLAPRSITTSPSGRTIVDFGQNLTGRVSLTVDGPAGSTVVLRHAEILQGGELSTENLRSALATDRYTLRGCGPETWEPRFTYHGFRYVEIDGWPGEPIPDSLEAVVCHSDMRRTGWFECSDERVNDLHRNVVWSMRGNFLDLPTDCPQRDERLGWTGDIAVFVPTAAFLYDTAGVLASWLADLAAEQDDEQGVPFVVPNTDGDAWIGTAVWGDAAVAVPWELYRNHGDPGLLRAQWPSMRRWIELVVAWAGPDRIWTGPQFGDWLDPAAPPDDPFAALTDPTLVANAWFCRMLTVMGEVATVLGETAEADRYAVVAGEARRAFVAEYVTPRGRLVSDTVTAHALAVHFDLVPEGVQRRRVEARLAELVRASGHHISTGFAGTPVVADALCDAGAVDDAYALLLQDGPPSWLYAVAMGATTVWERWDGLLPDGTRQPDQMNSFNHYALGSVADWLHRSVAGLAAAEPGYRRLLVRPLPGPGITSAAARHDTPYGPAEVAWSVGGGDLELRVVVPPNTDATVHVPGGAEPVEVGSGTHEWHVALGEGSGG